MRALSPYFLIHGRQSAAQRGLRPKNRVVEFPDDDVVPLQSPNLSLIFYKKAEGNSQE
jgi:hypothetical protein